MAARAGFFTFIAVNTLVKVDDEYFGSLNDAISDEQVQAASRFGV